MAGTEATAVTEPLEAMEDTEATMENMIWRRTKKRTKHPKILKVTKFLNLTTPILTTIIIKLMIMWMPEAIIKLTALKLRLTGICKTESTNTSKTNTESIHNSNLNPTMVTLNMAMVVTAKDTEVILMAVTENLTMEEAMEVTPKEVMGAVTEVDMVAVTDTEVAMDTEVNRTMVEVQDTEAALTAVTINPAMEEVRDMEAILTAVMTDRKTPKMDTNIQMKIKNEFGPNKYFSFYN